MAIFKYTLPSGSTYQMTAPDGTTQAEADKIFYQQVAAGTFVGYKQGDKLTAPEEALTNFGLSRLERGTAGVDDKTLLAIVNGLPSVATLPQLSTVPITNPVSTVDYLQVNSTTTAGRFSLGQSAVGPLDPQQVQALMGQLAAIVNQPANVMTQEKGVGTYGFSCQQLERAGYVSPGYCDRYCPVDTSTQQNSANMIPTLSAPGVLNGKNGVTSIDNILNDPAIQNQIQQELMQQSYDSLVAAGTIVPPAETPPPTTGQVYSDNNGTLLTTTGLALLAGGLGFVASGGLANTFGNLFSSSSNANSILGTLSVGSVTDSIKQFGSNAVATLTSGLDSIQSGATVFKDGIQGGLDQITSLASGNTSINSLITSNLDGDVGALITNTSKFGLPTTLDWAQNTGLNPDLASNLDILGKGSQFGINFADFSLSSLTSSVQPAAGFTNTVDRATVDAAVTRVIGSEKISSPSFSLPSLASLGVSADIAQAQSILKGLGGQAVNIGGTFG